ncbi:type II toxin-antitoxin system RelE/ParE family toxin [Rhizobium sp. AAP116]|uniref:type II toxin-antitoxin system RelE/ParE family toxin n=1 Tax=Rhizobium sp. AAP116 TaxID=1523429 RepID=UPI0006B9655C|nr:type II toxin-antitoxin system RelE/ParE family toxin [Rhizobium sp. AAP116]KPF59235.1 addiction module antitoxin RelB [Rhizobium sp. AAP116]
MFELKQTEIFRKWRLGLKDRRAAGLIAARLDRRGFGHVGDAVSVGGGVQELRLHYGPGYRIYFTQRGATIILLLCGGDKGSQVRDIETAKRLARIWKETDD